MTKKTSAIFFAVGALFTLILGTVGHFFYEWSGENKIAGIFFPVNESVWEHMKLTLLPTGIYLGAAAIMPFCPFSRCLSARRLYPFCITATRA